MVLFYYVVAFSSLLLNIGILIVHCRNLARALSFLFLFPFFPLFASFFPPFFPFFLSFLFICYYLFFSLVHLCKPKNSLAGRPAIIIIISLCLSKLIKLQTNVTSLLWSFLYRTVWMTDTTSPPRKSPTLNHCQVVYRSIWKSSLSQITYNWIVSWA